MGHKTRTPEYEEVKAAYCEVKKEMSLNLSQVNARFFKHQEFFINSCGLKNPLRIQDFLN